MRARDGAWHTNFTYVGDHAFVSFDNPRTIHWIKAEQNKRHLHFYHPTSWKQFQLLPYVRPEATPCCVLDILERIGDACASFQQIHGPPFRFRVSSPEDSLRCNADLAMDSVWLEKKPVLHIVDSQTSYQNEAFIRENSSECLCKLSVEIWAPVNCGFPDIRRIGREPSFMSQSFMQAAKACG